VHEDVSYRVIEYGLTRPTWPWNGQIAQQHYQQFDNLSDLLEKVPYYLDYLGVLSKCFDFWKLSQSFDFSNKILNLVTESYQIIFQILDTLAGVYEQSGITPAPITSYIAISVELDTDGSTICQH